MCGFKINNYAWVIWWSLRKYSQTHLKWSKMKRKQNQCKENKIKIKGKQLKPNGHFWPKYFGTHFGQQCHPFSKLNIQNFLHALKDHIKVSTLNLDNLAGTFPNAYTKNPKWQSINRNKIITKLNFTKPLPLCKPRPLRGAK